GGIQRGARRHVIGGGAGGVVERHAVDGAAGTHAQKRGRGGVRRGAGGGDGVGGAELIPHGGRDAGLGEQQLERLAELHARRQVRRQRLLLDERLDQRVVRQGRRGCAALRRGELRGVGGDPEEGRRDGAGGR